MRFLRDVGNVVEFSGGNMMFVQFGQDVIELVLNGPCRDRPINLVDLLYSTNIVFQGRVMRQVFSADDVHQALENTVAIAGNEYELIAFAPIGITGCDAGQAAA